MVSCSLFFFFFSFFNFNNDRIFGSVVRIVNILLSNGQRLRKSVVYLRHLLRLYQGRGYRSPFSLFLIICSFIFLMCDTIRVTPFVSRFDLLSTPMCKICPTSEVHRRYGSSLLFFLGLQNPLLLLIRFFYLVRDSIISQTERVHALSSGTYLSSFGLPSYPILLQTS